MTPIELKDHLILLSKDRLIPFFEGNKNQIRLLFLQATTDRQTRQAFQQIIRTITGYHLPENINATIQVQSFYIHLAFYFKKVNLKEFVETCHNHILDSVFKRRLDAWLNYKRYHNQKSHVDFFENYLQALSGARFEDEEDYTYDLLSDLQEYKDFVDDKLNPEIRIQVNERFESTELQLKYPLLKLFSEHNSQHIPGLEIVEYNDKEYEPSVFMESLFRSNFLDYVKEKSQPLFPQYLFGYHKETVIYDIIKQGQANFDETYGTLLPVDKVRLYCYFNMRKHYFTSLSLFERSSILEKFYNSAGRIYFIDIGCGPATSGLAFMEYLRQETNYPVVFEYYGIDVSEAMKQEANKLLTNEIFSPTGSKIYYSSVSEISRDRFKDATCIILNACYVFASKSLNVEELITFVKSLRQEFPYKPKYLLFQNPDNAHLNQNYQNFKNGIGGFTVDFSEVETIFYYTQRGQYFNVRSEPVYFEILKL